MMRTMVAMAAAALLMTVIATTSQAAPIAPLPSGITTAQGNLTQVYWHYHWHRHCWRGRHGYLHCW